MVQTMAEDKYVLPRNKSEQERLHSQHSIMTELLGGRLIVDRNVKIGPGHRVLDSATGAGSWIFDLLKVIPATVELVGIDISTSMFPKKVVGNVKFYEMSCLSLPEDWNSSFDLINQRLLIAAFTSSQWLTALSELFRVLKPGGVIQLLEVGNLGSLCDSSLIPATKMAYDYSVAIFRKRGLLGRDCGRQLPLMLDKVGFCDIQIENHKAPIGKHWGQTGVKGSRNWEVLFRTFGAACLKEGGLGVCESQCEVDAVIERAKQEWDENHGVFIHVYAVTARKPL